MSSKVTRVLGTGTMPPEIEGVILYFQLRYVGVRRSGGIFLIDRPDGFLGDFDPRIRWDYSKVDANLGNPGLPGILIK